MCQPVSGFVNQDNGYMVYWPGIYRHTELARAWQQRAWCANMDQDRFIPFEWDVAKLSLNWDFTPTKKATQAMDAFIGEMDAQWLGRYIQPNPMQCNLPKLFTLDIGRWLDQMYFDGDDQPRVLPRGAKRLLLAAPQGDTIVIPHNDLDVAFARLWSVPDFRNSYWRDK